MYVVLPQGITGSFSGVDASGRFKQATLQLGGGAASGGSKPSGSAAAGPGPASGAGAGRPSGGGSGARNGGSGFGYGVQQQQQPAKKKKIFDAGGAWNGCCFCGVRAKVRQGAGGAVGCAGCAPRCGSGMLT